MMPNNIINIGALFSAKVSVNTSIINKIIDIYLLNILFLNNIKENNIILLQIGPVALSTPNSPKIPYLLPNNKCSVIMIDDTITKVIIYIFNKILISLSLLNTDTIGKYNNKYENTENIYNQLVMLVSLIIEGIIDINITNKYILTGKDK